MEGIAIANFRIRFDIITVLEPNSEMEHITNLVLHISLVVTASDYL
jgi:hypothetical protein